MKVDVQAAGKTIINGVEYSGGSIIISNGEVSIDGKTVDTISQVNSIASETLSITIFGNVHGDVSSINGDIEVNGFVKGNIDTVNGDITCDSYFSKATYYKRRRIPVIIERI